MSNESRDFVWGQHQTDHSVQRTNESSAIQIHHVYLLQCTRTWLTTNLVCRQGSGNKTSWQETDEWKEEKRCPWCACGVYLIYFYIHKCLLILNIPVPAHQCVCAAALQQTVYICAFKLTCLGSSVWDSFSWSLVSLLACPPCVYSGSTYCWCDYIVSFILGLECDWTFSEVHLLSYHPSIHPSSLDFVFREPEQLILMRSLKLFPLKFYSCVFVIHAVLLWRLKAVFQQFLAWQHCWEMHPSNWTNLCNVCFSSPTDGGKVCT